jgi:multicomponent Na+:H+ antiporter subunit B
LKIVNYLILAAFAGLLIFASVGMSNRGDANAPMNREKSPVGSPGAAHYYIQHSKTDSHTDNMVTVILADWRGYDTLGEETVILTAGLICYLLLRKRKIPHDPER